MSPLVHEPRTAPCVQEWFRRGTEPRCARRHRLAAGWMDDDAGWRPPRALIQRAERHAFVASGGSALLVVLAFGRRVDSDRLRMAEPEANAEQIRNWNEAAGPKWVAFQKVIDAQIAPLGERAMDRAGIAPGERVIDVGCGCGDTTIALARRVGPAGLVLGIDISAPMLERAAETARAAGLTNVRFENADAERVRGILARAGFDQIVLDELRTTLTLGGGGALDQAVRFLTEGVGPVSGILREADPALRPTVAAAVRAAIAPFHGPEGVRMGSAAWIVTALAP